MNSFNHYAYGAIGEWMYRVIAGIEIDERAPGYRHNLVCTKNRRKSHLGSRKLRERLRYSSDSLGRKRRTIFVTIRIPVNTTAKLTLEESATEPEGDIVMQRGEDGLLSTEIGSGTWDGIL